ncbi:DUF2541 family protein [Parasalinivibrio latis]|uniref:DUF2541 family protein n=1 Tax=Parasalinivibrio latis TaxID=2952610 RepID=UPI0030E06DDB
MNTKKWVAKLCLALSLLGGAQLAHADDDFTLGRTILLGKSDHAAKIPLVVCRRTDAIQVKAEKGLFLQKVKVNFRNGESKTIQFQRWLKEDKKTAWREFAYKRCVKSLEVYGKAKDRDSTAGVRVYGRD